MTINFRLLCLLVLPFVAFSCSKEDDSEEEGPNVNANEASGEYIGSNTSDVEWVQQRLEFPKVMDGDNYQVLVHTTADAWRVNYCVEWDKEKKSQRWSCYQLNSALLKKNTSRYSSNDNQYPFDPELNRQFYPSEDLYYGSGFDHGHICPSADRLYSSTANLQTFYLTNMQPQYKNFNGSNNSATVNDRSPWYRLEGQVRSWANATTTEMLYVLNGGTIDDDKIIKVIDKELRVPKYFFVALLLKNAQGYKAVGFWMEHLSNYAEKLPLSAYAVNIRRLEQLTGIDFFCNLPDNVEEHVETLPVENVKRAWGL